MFRPQQALLRDAAQQIRTYQAFIAQYGSSAYETNDEISDRLIEFVERIDFRYADETRQIMLEAANAIRLLRLVFGIKQEIIDEFETPE